MNINQWALRWQIPSQCLAELLSVAMPERAVYSDKSEAAIQADIRVESSNLGGNLWRNNNGAAVTDDGRHIRFGLGNDSTRINKTFKSSDLIGITPVQVLQQHVGCTVGIFTAIEIKNGAWSWSGTEREQAQWKYLSLVQSKGGFASFAKSKEDYRSCIT